MCVFMKISFFSLFPPDLGMGLKVSKSSPVPQNGNVTSPGESSGGGEEEEEESKVKLYAKAVYAFSGTNDDEV